MCDIPLASDKAIDQTIDCHEEAQSLVAAGDSVSAGEQLDCALAILEEVSGPEHPDVAHVLNARGVVAQRQNDVVLARRCYLRAWRIGRSHVDVNSDEVDETIARIAVQALSNLGNLEREAGNWNRAGCILKRAVRMSRTWLGPNDLHTSNALNNLGMWCKFTGRFCLGGLAAIIADQGRVDEAELLYREAPAIFESVAQDCNSIFATVAICQ